MFRILKRCVRDRLLQVKADRGELLEQPIVPGRVYSACYLTKGEFDGLEMPTDSGHFVVPAISATRSSPATSASRSATRNTSSRRSTRCATGFRAELEEGLMHTLEDWIPANAEIQRSWTEADEPVVRFEDLLVDDEGSSRGP